MIGLSNKTGYDFLQISVMSPGAGAASIAAPYKYTTQATVFEQGIGITKADDIVNNNLFPVPNFIKIDVDGHERQILEGSSELFKMTELKAIMLELEFADPDDLNQVISQMKNFGFNLSKISDWKEFAKGYTIQNFLFEKK
jgi:hypothetical protein